MINWLHAQFHRPEKGWDPVPAVHGRNYADSEWKAGVREVLLEELECWAGGLKGKEILDLGGGPGHYSVAFAKRGAHVTWYDISHTYQQIARQKAEDNGVSLAYFLGYLDEAPRKLGICFDLVFNRICFNYGRSDESFSKVIFQLVKPGGVGYVDTTHSMWRRETLPLWSRLRTRLNDFSGIKIGHPFPPHGRLANTFANKNIEKMLIDYTSPYNDRIFFIRGGK